MKSTSADTDPSEHINPVIELQSNWKSDVLSRIRTVIKQADPEVIEEVKWRTASRPEGLPVWSNMGIVCIAETWKDNVKLIFFKGSHLKDPKKLFNARLKSKTDRAIEFHETTIINEADLRELIREAILLNKTNVRQQ